MENNLLDLLIFYVAPLFFLILYILYYRKYAFYQVQDEEPEIGIGTKVPRGKTPPPYPNGWYRLCRSGEIKEQQVKEIKLAGRQITFFRGDDHKAYALSSYCAHMGANLGHGGKVKFGNCIQCPFHGWTFDGDTGKCVNSEAKDPKIVATYEYCDIQNMGRNEEGNYLKKTSEGEVSIQKYHVREMNGFVYVWLHAVLTEPEYEPINMQTHLQNLQLRGESINFVKAHIQEIPENGADIKHFDYVHRAIHTWAYPWLQFRWDMKTCMASDPDYLEKTLHKKPKVRAYQKELYKTFLSDDRAKIVNIITLDNYVLLFEKWKIYTFSIIGFQTGPATVSLFMKGAFFETSYQQSIQPIDKYLQKVYHTFYASSFMPYWLTAYMLYGEFIQVSNDSMLWKQKIFSENLRYNMSTIADSTLLNWRNWYGQFFQGAEKLNQQTLDW